MSKRFVNIWFRYLKTDWFTRRHPELINKPFALAVPDHGRMVVTYSNKLAEKEGVYKGGVVADARAIIPGLQILDDKNGLSEKLLKGLAEWCIRYTPIVSIDPVDGLILDATGCAHLWGGEQKYIDDITTRLQSFGYYTRIGMADTIGAAWAITHYSPHKILLAKKEHKTGLLELPPAALRLNSEVIERLQKLGIQQIAQLIRIPRAALFRRFGSEIIKQLDCAFGMQEELIRSIQPIAPYTERLPCLEPISTITGIEIALQRLLETMSTRLNKEGKGVRNACFKCYRVDGKIEQITIGTHRPTSSTRHLFKLFENKLSTIEPALGIDLFILEALKVEDKSPVQEILWDHSSGLDNTDVIELIDRLQGKLGSLQINRFRPDEHYWPERSYKNMEGFQEQITSDWKIDKPRPIHLLSIPESIEVTAPIPDYPPMLFRHKGKLHKIIKADGPERIEQEWWLQQGQHRDYYAVEDEEGKRYWLFRLGHYSTSRTYQWYLHGFFA